MKYWATVTNHRFFPVQNELASLALQEGVELKIITIETSLLTKECTFEVTGDIDNVNRFNRRVNECYS